MQPTSYYNPLPTPSIRSPVYNAWGPGLRTVEREGRKNVNYKGAQVLGRGDERQPGMLKTALNGRGPENGSNGDSWGRSQGWLNVTQTTVMPACPQAFHLYANHLSRAIWQPEKAFIHPMMTGLGPQCVCLQGLDTSKAGACLPLCGAVLAPPGQEPGLVCPWISPSLPCQTP